MTHSLLIIDDEEIFAKNLQRYFEQQKPEITTYQASTETKMLKTIETTYFNMALVDLRMPNFSIDGFDLIKKIIELNPFAKIIIMSAYLPDYKQQMFEVTQTGRVVNMLEKGKFETFTQQVFTEIDKIVLEFEERPDILSKALEKQYADAKNETNRNLKGSKFEDFTALLFSQIGFTEIQKNFRDKSSNEIDLIIRNEISDNFFQKFKPYIFVECKNTLEKVDSAVFTHFHQKVKTSNGLSNLGFLITSNAVKRTAYLEALRSSQEDAKIIFITNAEIQRLIYTENRLKTLKKIIDEQVKDN